MRSGFAWGVLMKWLLVLTALFTAPAFAESHDPATVECVWEETFAIKIDQKTVFESAENQLQLMSDCSRGLLSATLNGGTVTVDETTGAVIPEAGYVVTVAGGQIGCELTLEEGFLLRIDGTLGAIVPGVTRVSTYFACIKAPEEAAATDETPEKSVVIDLEQVTFAVQ